MGKAVVNPIFEYQEINGILDELLSGVKTVLGSRLVGLYIHGSLASGEFNPQTSDIDFLVVTRSSLLLKPSQS